MKQINLFSLTKRNGTMDDKKKTRMRSLTQEEVVELVIWLQTNADKVNNKTLSQIERVLKKHGFVDHPPNAIKKCLLKFGIAIKRQPVKRKPIATTDTARLAKQIETLGSEIVELQRSLLVIVYHLIHADVMSSDSSKAFKVTQTKLMANIEATKTNIKEASKTNEPN